MRKAREGDESELVMINGSGFMVHESRSDLFLVGFFVGFWGGGFEGLYSFLAIYLEVSIYYRIFATERFRGQAAPQQ